ncbi:MAG: helix-turn-helix domain-containing protein [Micrococcales bacterium]|nr:helix-turn-helix domain-containing protein [Micrococcales bacterium]
MTTDAEPLLTSREVAALLRVSAATLSRWRDRGDGPAWLELAPGIPRYEADVIARWREDRRRER